MNGLPCVLTIDLGSSGPKVSVVDTQGRILATRSGHFENIYPDGETGVEQDAEAWWQQILVLCKEVLEESGVSQNVVAISNCAQYFTSVPVDENGMAVYNAIMWEDTRSGKYVSKAMGGFPSVQGYNVFKLLKWLKSVGIPPILRGVDGAGHALFLKHEKPDVYRKTYKILEPSDFLSMKFTGKFCTNENTGFAYALIQKAGWGKGRFDKKLIRFLKLDADKFPDTVPVGSSLGNPKEDIIRYLNIPETVQVFSGVVDTTAFMLGAGAFDEYDMVADLGTTLTTGMLVPRRIIDIMQGIFSLSSPLPDKYILVGELGSGTKALNFLIQNYLRQDDALTKINEESEKHYAALADEMASQSPLGSRGVVFMPWIYGASFPEQDLNLRGGFINLSAVTTRNDMIRAVFESYAFTLMWMVSISEKKLNRKVDKLYLCGGGALWNTSSQIISDALQIPVLVVDEPRQTNTRGMAFMCFHNLGLASYSELKKNMKIIREFTPEKKHADYYSDRFKFFKKLYKTMRPLHQTLNGM